MQVSPVWSSVAIRVVTTVKMQSQHPQLSTTSSDNDGVKLKTNFLQWKVLALPWKIITWGFGRLFMMLMSWPWSQWIGTNNKDNSLWFTHIERREGSKINNGKTQNEKFPSKRVFSRSSPQFLWDFPLQRERETETAETSRGREKKISSQEMCISAFNGKLIHWVWVWFWMRIHVKHFICILKRSPVFKLKWFTTTLYYTETGPDGHLLECSIHWVIDQF